MARSNYVAGVLLATLAAGLLLGCGTFSNSAAASSVRAPQAVPVRVVAASQGDLVVGADYAATVSARDQVNLVSLVTGRLEELRVDVSSPVKKGQVIAELSHGTLDAQLQQAQAGLRNARARLASAQAAARPNQINAQTRLLESDVAEARADLLSAQVKLSRDAEQLVARPIEQAVNGLAGLKDMTSTSTEGRATVRLTMVDNADLNQAVSEVDRIMSSIRPDGTQTDVRLKVAGADQMTLADLRSLPVFAPNAGSLVRLD